MKNILIQMLLLLAIFAAACGNGGKTASADREPANNDNPVPSVNIPPKPIIIVNFEQPVSADKPMSYKAFDQVQIDLRNSCVSDPENPQECLENWDEKYSIEYKWTMIESPTPFNEQSKVNERDWNSRVSNINFTGVMSTPRRYPEKNESFDSGKCASECGDEPVYDQKDRYFFVKYSDYLVCRQKYCERMQSKHYKINIQARTVDAKYETVSDTVEITLVPKIVPQARVVAQLTYRQGYKTRAEAESQQEGTAVDLDLHLIKKTSLEAENYEFGTTEGFSRKSEGLLGTMQRPKNMDFCEATKPECERYWRHDDCSYADTGRDDTGKDRTIAWHASFDYDNTYGGGNYENPETIGLGPITDNDGDGIPDAEIPDDQYLLVVGYTGCNSNYSDGVDRCDRYYGGEQGAYEVDARLEIFVDGEEVPRVEIKDRVGDNYAETSKNFKIRLGEWKAVAVIKWDSSLESTAGNQLYKGNAIVTDTAMPDEDIKIDPVSHPVCTFDFSDAVLIPVWDAETYRNYIETPKDEEWTVIGTCN